MKTETIYLGGGCFWCLEASFREVPGVIEVISGYSGGEIEKPSYESVSSGRTGHAEVVKVVYDPTQTSFHELLRLFFILHDPTQLNRQGNDIGTQYRSIILFNDEKQRMEVEKFINELEKSGLYNHIVTEIVPFKHFWPAEEYHQHYFEKHPDQAYCRFVVAPKVEKIKKEIDGGTDK